MISDLKKLFKIVWKRFGLWIIIFSLFTAMVVSFNVRDTVRYDGENLRKAVNYMAKDMNMGIDTQKLDKKFLEESDKIARAYVDKYDLKNTSSIPIEEEEDYEKYYEEMSKKYGKKYYLIEDPIGRYAYITKQLRNKPLDYFETNDSIEGYPESYAVTSVRWNISSVLLLVALIAFLITSLEQSLPYYEFTMMYPWKKSDEVIMKAIIATVFGLIILAINTFLTVAILKSSDLGSIISLNGVGSELLKQVLLIIGTSLITVATGMIAGNFVGHIGLLIIAIGELELIRAIIRIFISVFSLNAATHFDTVFDNSVRSWPKFFRPFATLLHTWGEMPYILGVLAIAILWAVLAYAVNKKESAERSGYLITSKPVEYVAKALAILSLTSLLYVISNAALYSVNYLFVNVITYGLSLLISYKLFDILFKVRLKF